MKKKILILIMCICMIVPMFAFASFADTPIYWNDPTGGTNVFNSGKYRYKCTITTDAFNSAPNLYIDSGDYDFDIEGVVYSSVLFSDYNHLAGKHLPDSNYISAVISPRIVVGDVGTYCSSLWFTSTVSSSNYDDFEQYTAIFYGQEDYVGGEVINVMSDLSFDFYTSDPHIYDLAAFLEDNTYINMNISVIGQGGGSIVVDDPDLKNLGDLIGSMFNNFGVAVVGLADGIKESVNGLIYDYTPGGEKVLSDFVVFVFVIAGLAIAMAVFWLIFRLIRFGRQR